MRISAWIKILQTRTEQLAFCCLPALPIEYLQHQPLWKCSRLSLVCSPFQPVRRSHPTLSLWNKIMRMKVQGWDNFCWFLWALTVECAKKNILIYSQTKQTPYREWNEPAVAHQDAIQKEWWPLLSVCVRWRVVRYFQAFLRPLHQQVLLLAACFLPSNKHRERFALKASLRKIKAFQFI